MEQKDNGRYIMQWFKTEVTKVSSGVSGTISSGKIQSKLEWQSFPIKLQKHKLRRLFDKGHRLEYKSQFIKTSHKQRTAKY